MTYNSLAELFTAIANSIRGKTGGTEKIVANDFPAAIDGISAGGGDDWIGDGNTHIWIHLEEGRTSPVLGVCPNGTVTVDWGDGTEPDVLTGTSTTAVKVTPIHEYAKSGDYVINLTVDGEMGFTGQNMWNAGALILRHSSAPNQLNNVYQGSVRKVEIGNGVTSIGNNAFFRCFSLTNISIPDAVTSIGNYAFESCYSLTNISIPDAVTSIGNYAFKYCRLNSISMPDTVTSIGSNVFYCCYSLVSANMSDAATSIGDYGFYECNSLVSVNVPDAVTSIGRQAFYNCYGVRVYDFANHAAVPTLSSTDAFYKIAADCEIRVPAALVDEWKAATNWSTYADKIVGV